MNVNGRQTVSFSNDSTGRGVGSPHQYLYSCPITTRK